MNQIFKIEEVAKIFGVEGKLIIEFVRKEWIQPVEPVALEFDKEDLARTKLILELIEDFGVNDESVPIILHLIDQLHGLHSEIKNLK